MSVSLVPKRVCNSCASLGRPRRHGAGPRLISRELGSELLDPGQLRQPEANQDRWIFTQGMQTLLVIRLGV